MNGKFKDRADEQIISRATAYVKAKYRDLFYTVTSEGHKITATHDVTSYKHRYSVCLCKEFRGGIVDHMGDSDEIIGFV